jgi:hypothetical protein
MPWVRDVLVLLDLGRLVISNDSYQQAGWRAVYVYAYSDSQVVI